jgi:hypothetical protein
MTNSRGQLTFDQTGSYLGQPLQVAQTFAEAGSVTLVTSDGSGRSIVVGGYLFSRSDSTAAVVNLTFKDSAGNTLWGPLDVATQGNGVTQGPAYGGIFMTAPGANLVLAADAAATIGGGINWFYSGGILP